MNGTQKSFQKARQLQFEVRQNAKRDKEGQEGKEGKRRERNVGKRPEGGQTGRNSGQKGRHARSHHGRGRQHNSVFSGQPNTPWNRNVRGEYTKWRNGINPRFLIHDISLIENPQTIEDDMFNLVFGGEKHQIDYKMLMKEPRIRYPKGDLQQIRKSNINKLQRASRDVPVNKTFKAETPMPWLSPVEETFTTKEGLDCVRVQGSEYLTQVEVRTTLATVNLPTNPGDNIYFIPLSPKYFPGTRLKKFSELYQKYKYDNLVVEYVPICPATQNGAIVGFITHDVTENTSLASDADTRLRLSMAHHAAHMQNVFDYGRTVYADDGTYGDYFTGGSDDARLNNQGMFYLNAASTYTPFDGSSAAVTIGNLIIHYDAVFCVRNLQEDNEMLNSFVLQMADTDWDNVFEFRVQGERIAIKQSFITAQFPAISTDPDILWLINVISAVTNDADRIPVQTKIGPTNLFDNGQCWFGYWDHSGSENIRMVITSSLDEAESRTADSVILVLTEPAIKPIAGGLLIRAYDMEDIS